MRQLNINNKNRKIFFFICLIIVFFFNCAGMYTKNNKEFEFTIKSTEKEIKKTNPITIELCFESNKYNYKIYKHSKLGMGVAVGPNDWLRFIIETPKGKIVEKYSSILLNPKRPYKGDFVEITSDSPYIEKIKLFPFRYNSKDFLWPVSGIYRLKAIYSFKHKDTWEYGKDLWEGRVESNWISVKVK